jgi:hypothetical protein
VNLTVLAIKDRTVCVGDDTGKIFTADIGEFDGMMIEQPRFWKSTLVRVPVKVQKLDKGRVEIRTRNIRLRRVTDIVANIDAVFGFDSVDKRWYVFHGEIGDEVPPNGDVPEGTGADPGVDNLVEEAGPAPEGPGVDQKE